MKKLLTVLLALSLVVVSAFSFGCGKTEEPEDLTPVTVSVYAPDGAPAISIAKFITDKENFGTNAEFNYNVVKAENIGAVMQKGEGDVIIMPINAASKLYSAKGYKMAAVLTHGNLYIMAKENLTLNDLKGKVVGVTNLANVPGLTFKAILTANGIEYEESETAIDGKVALKGYNDGSELIPALKSGKLEVGLLPEPAANKLTQVAEGYDYALNLQTLYAESGAYPQAVLMVKTELTGKFPQLINDVKEKFDGGIIWAKENIAAATSAIANALPEGVTPSLTEANLNATVIDNCKIFWQDGEAAKVAVNEYLQRIIQIAPVAANAVAEDFFA